MRKNKVVIDFKDLRYINYCIVKTKDKKIIKSKSKIMTDIFNERMAGNIKIKSYWQFFRDSNYDDCTVCKYVIKTPNTKIIIKNVANSDLYFDQLEALSDYRNKIIFSKYDYYPDVDGYDMEFDNPDSKKRR